MSERLLLASASPRRRDLLDAIGVPHDVRPAEVSEPSPGSLAPGDHVLAAARAKARAVARLDPGRLVLGADTVVAVGHAPSDVLGKPADTAEARRMLSALSGRRHEVLTAVVLAREGARAATAERVAVTRVTFTDLSPSWISRYVATGEPLDKAGAYAVQGRAAGSIRRLDGSWSNVVGLPLEELPDLFHALGEKLEDWQDW